LKHFSKGHNSDNKLMESFSNLATAAKSGDNLKLEEMSKEVDNIGAYVLDKNEARLKIAKVLEKFKTYLNVLKDIEKYSWEIFTGCTSKVTNINEFYFFRDYSKVLAYRDSEQYYTNILNSTEFKTFFEKIFLSKCHESYYEQLGNNYKATITKENLSKFWECVKEVPMYRNSAGITFSSLYVFINSNPLYTECDFTENQIKAVSSL
jgi:virulence-associated protein VapD